MPDLTRKRKFIVNTVYIAIIVGLVFLVFRYLLNLLWPFFIAFLFSLILHPVIRLLTAKCHVKYNLSVTICLILFFALAGGIVLACSAKLVSFVADFVVMVPGFYTNSVEPALENFVTGAENLANRISPSVYDLVTSALPNVISSISTSAANLAAKLVAAVSGWATKLPGRLLSAVICIIATVFMTADFSRITSFILRQFPEKPRMVIREAKTTFVEVVGKYAKSYGLIMLITFGEIFLGLLVIGQKNAVFIAALIAVFDIFPIVGAGLILFPWALITLLNGALGQGIGLILLWITVIIVRQIMEPRIVGHQVGLHPLVTLMSIFIGSKLFGGIGLFGLPITCAIIKSLDDTGVIHFLRKPEDVSSEAPPAPPPAETPKA